MDLRPFSEEDREQVLELWQACGLTRPWNDPQRDIDRKLSVQPELFFVGSLEGELVATAMAGWDGHRGSVYYLAVHPDWQGCGLGRQLMGAVEAALLRQGCPKANILVRTDNADAAGFYQSIGYQLDAVSCYGRRLVPDGALLGRELGCERLAAGLHSEFGVALFERAPAASQPRAALDALLQSQGLQPLGERWNPLPAERAISLLGDLVREDLLGGWKVRHALPAEQIIALFTGLFDADSVAWFSNVHSWREDDSSRWTPFSAGGMCVCLAGWDAHRLGLLWTDQ